MRRIVLAPAGVAAAVCALSFLTKSAEPATVLSAARPSATEPESAPTYDSAYWTNPARSLPARSSSGVPRATDAGTSADSRSVFPRQSRSGSTAALARPPRTSGTPTEYLADALFRRLDINRDGVLTGDEIPSELRASASEDGSIDHATFVVLFRAAVQRLGAERDRQPARAVSANAVPAWFTELDSEGTGRVSREQWLSAGHTEAEFQRLDADGDGFLTAKESQSASSGPRAAATTADPAPKPDASPDGTASGSGQVSAPGGAAVRASRADALFAHYTGLVVGRPASAPKGTPAAPAAAKPSAVAAAPTPAAPKAPAAPLLNESATLPLPLDGNAYWIQRDTENLTALLAGDKPNVLFLGDSITDLLAVGAGKQLWNDAYAPLGASDFAVSGTRTAQVLWQVETGQVAMAAPSVVVLMIGTNNLGIGQSPQEAAAGVEAIVSQLGEQLPDTRILLLGVLPRGASASDPFRAKIVEVNERLADLHDGKRVTFLDIGGWFRSPDGSISPAVMPDALHPSLQGYQLYTEAIWGTLTGMLPQQP
jgi:lysophospholipase L1-like esterase